MGEVQNQQEAAFPVKRKPDLSLDDQNNCTNKAPKLQSNPSLAAEEANGSKLENLDSSAQDKIENPPLNRQEIIAGEGASRAENNGGEDHKAVGDDEEDEDEDLKSEAVVDGKVKMNFRDDKGKGKLIEEEDDEDDADSDDSDDGSSEVELDSDGDSDLSDDPLAEVDLDNILPSRTRRRVMQPGVFISDQIDNYEDDDSDDSDA